MNLRKILYLFSSFVIIVLGINTIIIRTSADYIYKNLDQVPQKTTAIILGAKVYNPNQLSDMLLDRAEVAAALYHSKKVLKILVSGDHGRKEYDEVNAVRRFLLDKGVVAKDIFLDHAGFDTYDSMYRARHIFDVDAAVIVSQDFHLARAVYIARNVGMDAVGVVADRRAYPSLAYNRGREILSRIKAFFSVVLNVKPKYLGPHIPISGSGLLSWDTTQ